MTNQHNGNQVSPFEGTWRCMSLEVTWVMLRKIAQGIDEIGFMEIMHGKIPMDVRRHESAFLGGRAYGNI